jgi:hypothetical protein
MTIEVTQPQIPTPLKLLAYIFNLLCYFCHAMLLKLKRQRVEWHVSYSKGPWETTKLSSGKVILNPIGRYFADPFIICRNGRTICFVEDYSYQSKKGCISAIEIFDENSYKIIGPIITETFHMSFPFLFEYENDLYMTPETSECKSIRLYKSISFPDQWEYQYDLLNGDQFLDTIIIKRNDKWHLLTNLPDFSLNIFSSLNPISKNWIPHNNPILIDSNLARNGGILFDKKGDVIRCRQNQGFNLYGESLTLAKITSISNSFNETEIKKILPDFFPGIKGCHHINSNINFTVYDYLK